MFVRFDRWRDNFAETSVASIELRIPSIALMLLYGEVTREKRIGIREGNKRVGFESVDRAESGARCIPHIQQRPGMHGIVSFCAIGMPVYAAVAFDTTNTGVTLDLQIIVDMFWIMSRDLELTALVR